MAISGHEWSRAIILNETELTKLNKASQHITDLTHQYLLNGEHAAPGEDVHVDLARALKHASEGFDIIVKAALRGSDKKIGE
jgi:hypothetical protein